MKQLLELWIFKTLIHLLIIGGNQDNLVLSVPIEFDDIDNAYDLDTEQSEARYDPRLLSQELQSSDLDSQGAAESCVNANRSYEHGAKLPRLDPCEICLCIDGEVFCWWKQCEIPIKKPSKTKLRKSSTTKGHSKPLNFSNKSMEKSIPNSILSFPQNLPLHLALPNDTDEKTTLAVKKHLDPPKKYSLPILSTTTTTVSSSLKTSGKTKMFSRLQHTVEATNKFNIPENILNSNVPPIIVNSKFSDDPYTFSPSFQTTENTFQNNDYLQPMVEKYQINNQTTLHAQHHTATIRLPQHYIITSSGNIEMDPELDDDTNLNTDESGSESVDDNYQKYVSDWSDTASKSDDDIHERADNNFNATQRDSPSVSAPMTQTSEQQSTINQQEMSAPAITNLIPAMVHNASDMVFSTLSDTSSAATQTSAAVAAAAVVALASETMMRKMASVPSTSILAETTTIVDTTTMAREKTCMVMGKIYGIGSILPQETGNCLQCICTEGINIDDPPRVTCNPHNCPPLVLPDLFDNTGY